MGYSSGFLDTQIMYQNPVDKVDEYGTYIEEEQEVVPCYAWANVSFAKGMRAMREGALEAYETVMIRMRWTDTINRYSVIHYDFRQWRITSFNADYRKNEIQITAVETKGQI